MFLHMVYLCGNKYRSTEGRKAKAIYSEHNKEAGHDHLCLARPKGKQRTEKAFFKFS